MENGPEINVEPINKDKEREAQEKIRYGTVTHKNGLGYFIVPDGDPQGVVDIPNADFKTLPPEYKLGDRVRFRFNKMREGVDVEKINEEER